jgi:hypothetical protein
MRLHELRRLGAVAERPPDFQNVSAEYLRLNVGIRPDAFEQLVVRDQPPGVLDEVLQHSERLRHERDARVATPQTLIFHVQPKWLERSHEWSWQFSEHSSTSGNTRYAAVTQLRVLLILTSADRRSFAAAARRFQ